MQVSKPSKNNNKKQKTMIYKIEKRVRANSVSMKLEKRYIVYERKDNFWSKLFKLWYYKASFATHEDARDYIELLKEEGLYICNGGTYI